MPPRQTRQAHWPYHRDKLGGRGGRQIPHQLKVFGNGRFMDPQMASEEMGSEAASATAPRSSGHGWSFIVRPDSASCNLSTAHYPKINPGIEGEVHIHMVPGGASASQRRPGSTWQPLRLLKGDSTACPPLPPSRQLSIRGCFVSSPLSLHTWAPHTDLGAMPLAGDP